MSCKYCGWVEKGLEICEDCDTLHSRALQHAIQNNPKMAEKILKDYYIYKEKMNDSTTTG
ncbi:hypothetical protein LCGC14_2230460 [marine sediment metagenome]|uniref:Uncharacterized protein n=1 Tax=marine sediment metagenome TaxID=412755 RepID=A0A0F9D8A5_9ZZZZ